jgi:tetratricopeptide (TPR) repeat protein
VSSWLQRFLRPAVGDKADQRLIECLQKRALYDTTDEFLRALLDAIPAKGPLSSSQLAALVKALRGLDGLELPLQESAEVEAHLRFWRDLAEKTECLYARGCYADTLLHAGRTQEAMEVFLEVFEKDPALMVELGDDELDKVARSAGQALYLRYRLAWLWAALIERADSEDDTIRERYSELLEEHAADEAALKHIRRLGRALDQATQRGEFPRALVRRGPTRHET